MILTQLFAALVTAGPINTAPAAAAAPTPEQASAPGVVTIENFYKIIDERNLWSIHDQDYVPSWSLVSQSNFDALNQALFANGIQSKNEIAMFLAQAIYQTSGFSTINDWNMPTQKYFIRGYFRELSNEDEYRQASMALFNDDRLVKDPSLAVDGKNSWDVAVWYWKNVVKKFPGVVDTNGKMNFGAITRALNDGVCAGPSPRTGNSESGWPIVGAGALSFKLYDIAYRALGVEEPKSTDCGCMAGQYSVTKNQIFANTMAAAFESQLTC